MSKKPLTDKTGEVRELMSEDMQAMRPASEVLPVELLSILPKRKIGQRGPQIKPTKISLTLRYSPEVVHYFKATGKGWQARIDSVLKKWIIKHSYSG